ncbi:MAG TPA: hypothetical protein VHB54_14055 [Mucilaginibacter sp.]|nr:hypothetical protein [Mucilaginibacter sp.]
MKKLLIALALLCNAAFAQKMVKNGTIYKEHPYIEVVKKLAALYQKGDADGMARCYASNAQLFGMTRYTPDSAVRVRHAIKGKSLAEAKAGWQHVIDGWENIKMTPESAPDGLQYADAPFTVQSWWQLTMVNKATKKTAVIEMVLFDMFDKQGKIVTQFEYYDPAPMLAAMQ